MDENRKKLAERLYAGVVYDAMAFDLKAKEPFLLRKEVKPVWNFEGVMFGPAFTCRGERVLDESHIDDAIRIEMFKSFYPGCVQVVSSGGYREIAQFGDISGKIARKFGAVGAVVDAPTRDARLIKEDGFHLFSDGVQCVDAYGKWQIVEFEVPVIMEGIQGDVVVEPGDFIFGDTDGVIRIPKQLVDETLACAVTRLERENRVRAEVSLTDDIQALYDKVGRW